jgi:uncharacterized protein
MRLALYGGFGEKGRTSIGLAHDGFRVIVDAGVKTSVARDAHDYYPAIPPAGLAGASAMIVTHGHEDHAGGIGWCLAHGFHGRILMTAQTRREADDAIAAYAPPAELARFRAAQVDLLPPVGERFDLGPFRVSTGRSGHVAGGVWCTFALRAAGAHAAPCFAFCGDVVPASPVFAMDALPRVRVVALDASYGDDDVAAAQRAAQVATWVAAHPQGCVLPTPLFGRSIELLAIVPGPLALAPHMRDALEVQVADTRWLVPGAAERLEARLAQARDWTAGEPLPAAALLCHDGMGMAGPARDIVAQARATRHPVLFTGHLPDGSPGERMLDDRLAAWIRLPTHPTRTENQAMARECGAALVLGHSCPLPALADLARDLPALQPALATGQSLDLDACLS